MLYLTWEKTSDLIRLLLNNFRFTSKPTLHWNFTQPSMRATLLNYCLLHRWFSLFWIKVRLNSSVYHTHTHTVEYKLNCTELINAAIYKRVYLQHIVTFNLGHIKVKETSQSLTVKICKAIFGTMTHEVTNCQIYTVGTKRKKKLALLNVVYVTLPWPSGVTFLLDHVFLLFFPSIFLPFGGYFRHVF